MENNNFFKKFHCKNIIIAFFVFFMCIQAINAPQFAIIVIVLTIPLSFFLKKRRQSMHTNLLKDDSPNKLIEKYEKFYGNRNMIPEDQIPIDNKIYLCYNKAYVYNLYGEFEKALETINSIYWEDKTLYFQSLEAKIQALTYYLRDNNYNEGLRLSILARNLVSVAVDLPEIDSKRKSYDLFVQIGELLTQIPSEEELKNLEAKYNEAQIFDKILIAWSLSIAYSKINNKEKSTLMQGYCKELAPYCTPLILEDL